MIKIVKESLNERYLDIVDISDVNLDGFIKKQSDKDFLLPFIIQYAYEELGESLDYEDNDRTNEIEQTEDFKNWLKYEFEYKFDELKNDLFYNLIDENGYITLYRSMTVPNDYLDKLNNCQIKRIGEYWTYDFDSAEPHWGYNDNKRTNRIIFETKINEKYVNWDDTFRLNLEDDVYNDEKEIRLYKNTPLEIEKVWWNGEEIELENSCLFKS